MDSMMLGCGCGRGQHTGCGYRTSRIPADLPTGFTKCSQASSGLHMPEEAPHRPLPTPRDLPRPPDLTRRSRTQAPTVSPPPCQSTPNKNPRPPHRLAVPLLAFPVLFRLTRTFLGPKRIPQAFLSIPRLPQASACLNRRTGLELVLNNPPATKPAIQSTTNQQTSQAKMHESR